MTVRVRTFCSLLPVDPAANAFTLSCEFATTTAVRLFPYDMKRYVALAVRDPDLVYVGGGNTPAMRAVWHELGFSTLLRSADEAGTLMAGISAGANIWFERYVTDNVPGGAVRDGMGWLHGCFCPHLDSEPWREPVLAAQPSPVVGAGDGVVLLYQNELCTDVVCSRSADVAVFRERRRGGELQSRRARELPA